LKHTSLSGQHTKIVALAKKATQLFFSAALQKLFIQPYSG